MISEPQRLALLEGSKLRLAAKARLAEGGKDARYEAAVLLHAAARAERRVLLAVEAPSAEARLANAIERCGSLIDGLDPMAVLEEGWPAVLDASARVEERCAASLRSRIDPRMSSFIKDYQNVLAKLPALRAWMEAGAPWSNLRALSRELDRFLAHFPGDARMWCMRSGAYMDGEDVAKAWIAIRRARSLAPEDTLFRQAELWIMPHHLPPAEVTEKLDAVYAEIGRGEPNADLCFGFVSAAIQLAARTGFPRKLLQQALDVAMVGWRVPPLWQNDRKMFRAMQFILHELLAGRKPTIEILYRCGLGQWAVANPDRSDPMAILMERITPLRSRQAA